MKKLYRMTLINLLGFYSFSATADITGNQYNQQTSSNTQTLVQYLLNLGGFLGYDLTQSPTANNKTIRQELINLSATQLAENYLFNTLLGAIPVNTFSKVLSQFLPSNFPGYNAINAFANYTFTTQAYNSPASDQQGTLSVNPLIDQQTFQQDPVSQAVLNILATPDYSYCMNNDGSAWDEKCHLLYQNKVMANVIGELPNTYDYYGYQYNQKFLSQLNSNSLMSPLMYSTENTTSNTTSSTTPNTQNAGLTAQSQAQQAANFIRYAAGIVAPASLPKLRNYDTLYSKAKNADGSTSQMDQMQAQALLTSYFTSLRVYAAQTTVGLGNLYYILSKRLPQNQSASGSNPTSQAMSEFIMATRRLYNPDLSPNKQWINQINDGSPATVQKEMAILLAEINYQLYLNRQQEERMLLTSTMMLIQNTKASQPSADFANQGAAAAATQ